MDPRPLTSFSKEAFGRCLKDFPVASWRSSLDHIPIITSLPLDWKCWYARRPPATRLNRPTQDAMRDASEHHTTLWNTFETQLQQQCETYESFVSHAIAQAATIFRPAHKAPQPDTQRSMVAQLWAHYAAVRNTKIASLNNLFQAWMHSCHVQKLKRQLTQSCRQAKQDRLLRAVQAATEAAQANESRRLFRFIRNLTPPTRFRGLSLVSPW